MSGGREVRSSRANARKAAPTAGSTAAGEAWFVTIRQERTISCSDSDFGSHSAMRLTLARPHLKWVERHDVASLRAKGIASVQGKTFPSRIAIWTIRLAF